MRNQIDWDLIRIFIVVVESGSFTEAARKLGSKQSTISRHVKNLETFLNTALFRRHTRHITLTDQGRILYKFAESFSTEFLKTKGKIYDSQDKPMGELRVASTVAFSSLWLAPRMKKFSDQYPEISVLVYGTDDDLDLVMNKVDCAIRFGQSRQINLIQRRLFRNKRHVCGSKKYFEDYGIPKTVDDLDQHNLIAYSRTAKAPFELANWILTEGREVGSERKPKLSINSNYGVLEAVLSDIGVAMLSSYVIDENPDIQTVLKQYELPGPNVYMIFPSEVRESKRLKVFRDFLIEETKNINQNN